MQMMIHPKMRYTYIGIDSHKDTHTAVIMDCFYEKLGVIDFDNRPSKFGKFLADAEKFKIDGTDLLFGLEDVAVYGRSLMAFLNEQGQLVKHVNSFAVARERKNQSVTQKTDAIDAQCAARVLINRFDTLPDAAPHDRVWILRSLVARRKSIIRSNSSLKNHLHGLLTAHYPNYRNYFRGIDGQTSLAFFMRYPSPATLIGVTVEELTGLLFEASGGRIGVAKAQEILGSLEDTAVELQEIRDLAVQSAIRQMQFNLQEIEQLDKTLAKVLAGFDCTLTSMNGIDVVSAAQLLSCIGDVTRFPTPAKLAQYAGIAPVTYASGKTDLQFANKRGNRELNSLFFMLAVRVTMTVTHKQIVVNPFFYEYYHRKISEGKTKKQALKCVQRRLVNIIWTMLRNNEDYVNPPMLNAPKKDKSG
jgi:transposase